MPPRSDGVVPRAVRARRARSAAGVVRRFACGAPRRGANLADRRCRGSSSAAANWPCGPLCAGRVRLAGSLFVDAGLRRRRRCGRRVAVVDAALAWILMRLACISAVPGTAPGARPTGRGVRAWLGLAATGLILGVARLRCDAVDAPRGSPFPPGRTRSTAGPVAAQNLNPLRRVSRCRLLSSGESLSALRTRGPAVLPSRAFSSWTSRLAVTLLCASRPNSPRFDVMSPTVISWRAGGGGWWLLPTITIRSIRTGTQRHRRRGRGAGGSVVRRRRVPPDREPRLFRGARSACPRWAFVRGKGGHARRRAWRWSIEAFAAAHGGRVLGRRFRDTAAVTAWGPVVPGEDEIGWEWWRTSDSAASIFRRRPPFI